MAAPVEIVPGLVSVVIPTYNRAALLVESIRSVRAQTYTHFEIIVADDGSADDTATQASGFPGVQFLTQKNAGPSAARNLGLKKCRGEYVAFLDSDDLWSPQFLTESLRGLAVTGAGLVFSNWREVDALGHETCGSKFVGRKYLKDYLDNPVGDWFKLDPARARDLFLRRSACPPTAVLMRRNCLPPEGWDEQARVGEDRLFFLDALFASGCSAAFTYKSLWTFRVHAGNTHAGNPQIGKLAAADIYSKEQILKRHGRDLGDDQLRAVLQAIAADYFDWGWAEAQAGHQPEALRHLRESFRRQPRLKTLVAMVKARLR